MDLLVTGGTGSFGQAFVRRWLATPRYAGRVIVYSRDEAKQWTMRRALERDCPEGADRLRFFLGDIRDRDRLRRALDGVNLVIHAAALKQVPALEYNPAEAVKTNITGALNLIDAAIDAGVEKVIALSSDKAVQSFNLYGKTKAVMESLLIQANVYSPRTRFACVRYGNVFGSRGSVVALWREQAATGRITVTDPQMTRFFLTLGQASAFVLRSYEHMDGGEVFVPKLASVRMQDLANAVAPDAAWDLVGRRPGEKSHEVLISEDEAWNVREGDDHYIVYPTLHDWPMTPRGIAVADDFTYRSDTNPDWLSAEELKQWLAICS